MAVTIVKRPFDLIPAHNDAWFYATSTQTAQPNFQYYISVTVNSLTYNFKVDADTNGACYWNARTIIEKFVSNYYPFGDGTTGGFVTVTDGLNTFVINIGEYYGSTPTVHVGSDITIKAWNGSLKIDERRDYTPEDYGVTASEIIWLNNFDTEIETDLDKDLTFYFLQYSEPIDSVQVDTFNAAGSNLNTFTINNSITSLLTYICINLGPDYLEAYNIANPGAVTAGSNPLFSASVAYYTITFNASPGGGELQKSIRVNIDSCSPRFENKTLFYLNRFGAYDPVNLYGNHQKDISITKTFYRGLTPALEESHRNPGGTVYLGPNPQSINKKVLSSSYQTNQTLQSDWLTDHQREALADLFATPSAFLNMGVGDYKRVVEEDTSYKITNKAGDKLYQLQVRINEGVTERRQLD